MEKVVLLAGLLGPVLVPMAAARARHPRRSLKALVVGTLLFNAAYVVAVRWLYPLL